MKIAILVTNTDTSAFAARHPDDGVKFAELLHSVRQDWEVIDFAVKDGVFPESLEEFDGLIVSGSPASVHDKEPWVTDLISLIREADRTEKKLFGACFGHQAVALALGGAVDSNPNGWAWGRVETHPMKGRSWTDQLPEDLGMYAAHIEQVTKLPDRAENLFSTTFCPNAGFAVGQHIFTTQYHPEMDHDFVEDLTISVRDEIGADVADAALGSLDKDVDQKIFAEAIARFFEG